MHGLSLKTSVEYRLKVGLFLCGRRDFLMRGGFNVARLVFMDKALVRQFVDSGAKFLADLNRRVALGFGEFPDQAPDDALPRPIALPALFAGFDALDG
jgi:hypothetical protein